MPENTTIRKIARTYAGHLAAIGITGVYFVAYLIALLAVALLPWWIGVAYFYLNFSWIPFVHSLETAPDKVLLVVVELSVFVWWALLWAGMRTYEDITGDDSGGGEGQ